MHMIVQYTSDAFSRSVVSVDLFSFMKIIYTCMFLGQLLVTSLSCWLCSVVLVVLPSF